jgi:hypothetical protein
LVWKGVAVEGFIPIPDQRDSLRGLDRIGR